MVRQFLLLACLCLGASAHAADPKKYPRCHLVEPNFDVQHGLEQSSFDISRRVEPDRMRVVFDKDIEEHAIETVWKPGDFIAHGYRTEVSDQCLTEEGVPFYYSLAFKIPKDMPLDPKRSVLIGQFHTPDANHKPQIALRYRGTGHFDITFNFKTPDMPGITPSQLQKKPIRIVNLERGVWHKLEMVVIWTSGMGGRTDIVFNGWHVLRYEGPTNFTSQKGRGPYFKFGLYPSDGNSKPLKIRHARYTRMKLPSSEFLMMRNFYSPPMRLEAVTYMVGDQRREVMIDAPECLASTC
ncbi:MAG: heparin lyase I family protein [Pseudomonadota bacterium]